LTPAPHLSHPRERVVRQDRVRAVASREACGRPLPGTAAIVAVFDEISLCTDLRALSSPPQAG